MDTTVNRVKEPKRLDLLPNELQTRIWSFTPDGSLASVAGTCRRTHDTALWVLYRRDAARASCSLVWAAMKACGAAAAADDEAHDLAVTTFDRARDYGANLNSVVAVNFSSTSPLGGKGPVPLTALVYSLYCNSIKWSTRLLKLGASTEVPSPVGCIILKRQALSCLFHGAGGGSIDYGHDWLPMAVAVARCNSYLMSALLAAGATSVVAVRKSRPAAQPVRALHLLAVMEPMHGILRDRMLSRFQADIDARMADGMTPLTLALSATNTDLVSALVARGATINPPAHEEPGPLAIPPLNHLIWLIGAWKSQPWKMHWIFYQMVVLILAGADINRMWRGQTCLTVVIRAIWDDLEPEDTAKPSEKILRMLIDAGADVNQGDAKGCTPVQIVIRRLISAQDASKAKRWRHAFDLLCVASADPNGGAVWVPSNLYAAMRAWLDGNRRVSKPMIQRLCSMGARLSAHEADDILPDWIRIQWMQEAYPMVDLHADELDPRAIDSAWSEVLRIRRGSMLDLAKALGPPASPEAIISEALWPSDYYAKLVQHARSWPIDGSWRPPADRTEFTFLHRVVYLLLCRPSYGERQAVSDARHFMARGASALDTNFHGDTPATMLTKRTGRHYPVLMLLFERKVELEWAEMAATAAALDAEEAGEAPATSSSEEAMQGNFDAVPADAGQMGVPDSPGGQHLGGGWVSE